MASMGPLDVAGVVGVLMILVAYAGAQLHRMDPAGLAGLLMNFAGACLIMASLTRAFNLSAFLMEGTWAAVSLFGLVRLSLRRRQSPWVKNGRAKNGGDDDSRT